MIEHQQWRVKIGAFAGGRSLPPTSRNTTSGFKTSSTISPRSLYGVAIRGLILYSYIIIIVYMLLLRSGNVELNPGPVNCKSCPKCLNETVPIKLKVCTCGYVFHKKTHREPPKCRSIPLTTVMANIMTDIDDVPIVQSQPKFVPPNVVINTDTVDDSESPIPESKPSIEKMSTSQKWEKYKVNINKKRRSKYRCNPSPVKAKQREAYKNNPLPVRERVKQAYKLNPSPIKAHKREAYRCNPSPIKAKKREEYKCNPSPIKAKKREEYKCNPSPIKAKKREEYKCNPSPIKAKIREEYKCNPSPIKAKKREEYKCNPSPIKAQKREAYMRNPSPIKKRVNKAYNLNPSPVKARKREAYRCNPSPVKERNRLAYHVNPTLAKARSKSSYYNDHECTKHERRQTYNWHKKHLIDRRSLEKLVACAVSKKYKKLRENLPKNNFKSYVLNIIKNLSRKKITSSDVEVEHLVQSCMYFRDMNRKKFIHAFKKLKLLVLATLSKLQDTSDDPYEIILGPSMHTASSKSFFPASTYHKDALDKDGNVDISKFPVSDVGKKHKNWTCVSGLCKLDNKPEIASNVCKIYNSIGECDPIKARHYIQHMDDCDHPESHDKSLAGHSELCHLDDDACKSKLLYLRRLAPHFPNVRQLVNMIYNVKRTDTQVSRIDQALQTGNVDVLREISAEQKCAY